MEVNWPAVALVLGLAALALFRAPLSRLLERTEKVKDWIIAPNQAPVPSDPAKALPTRDLQEEQRAVEALTRGFDSELLMIQEGTIRDDLGQHGFKGDSACEKVLIKHLAVTQIALQFERVYHSLYRSQLEALRWLNSQGSGVHARQLRPFYDAAVRDWPGIYAHYAFQDWLVFLAANGLIVESDESAAAAEDQEPYGIMITVRGREFLGYLVSSAKTDPIIG